LRTYSVKIIKHSCPFYLHTLDKFPIISVILQNIKKVLIILDITTPPSREIFIRKGQNTLSFLKYYNFRVLTIINEITTLYPVGKIEKSSLI